MLILVPLGEFCILPLDGNGKDALRAVGLAFLVCVFRVTGSCRDNKRMCEIQIVKLSEVVYNFCIFVCVHVREREREIHVLTDSHFLAGSVCLFIVTEVLAGVSFGVLALFEGFEAIDLQMTVPWLHSRDESDNLLFK